MPHVRATLVLLPALLLFAACDSSTSSSGVVRLQDNCDPATFNAALGAGACQHSSSGTGMTFTAFNSELTAHASVAAWTMIPTTMSVREGARFAVVNNGGETHTYTEVDEFGGGVVPALNQASGNPTPAPECLNAAEFDSSTVRSGQTTQHTFDEKGTEKYQCCIHPWMRQTVTVR
jgi:plastocyanin